MVTVRSRSRVTTQAFTLIELLIVVAIIGILAAIAVPNFLNAQTRAKVARVEGDFKALSTALEMYRTDRSVYPPFMPAAGPNDWGRWGLIKLTTPVSYIGSSLLEDPFMRQKDATNHPGTSYGPPFFYIYHDRPTALAAGFWTNYDPEKKYECFVVSYGPDGLYYHGSGPYNWLISYNPSNGLYSWGNIYNFCPGNARESQINIPG